MHFKSMNSVIPRQDRAEIYRSLLKYFRRYFPVTYNSEYLGNIHLLLIIRGVSSFSLNLVFNSSVAFLNLLGYYQIRLLGSLFQGSLRLQRALLF
ncbi:hypothetical protein ES332_A03G014400v1 [Gossypium tomentosum]|uniref:Uncharacterized protein n=1 Tax=Gossypium tomentosum TaxID=34277 RepID=A0A5D2R3Z3_GOSTO|nr:hypothetical protein ES332_A03G014400v1 [Gossypium tomentosum]